MEGEVGENGLFHRKPLSDYDLKLEFMICGPLAIISFWCAYFVLSGGIFRWLLTIFATWMALVAILNFSDFLKKKFNKDKKL